MTHVEHPVSDDHQHLSDDTTPPAADDRTDRPTSDANIFEGCIEQLVHNPVLRQPHRLLRLPPLRKRKLAADMLAQLPLQPLATREQWQDSYYPTAKSWGSTRTPEFPYESRRDPSLARYWAQKQGMRRRRTQARRSQHHSAVEPSDERRDDSKGRSPSASPSLGSATSPHSLMSAESCTSQAAASWNVSSFPLNHDPVARTEFDCLRHLFAPADGRFALRNWVRNVDLSWLRSVVSGEVAAADLSRFAEARATKNLRNAPFETALRDDVTHYVPDVLSWTKTIINSPRSTIILMRNGVQLYDLMARPFQFYATGVDRRLSPEDVRARGSLFDAERRALLQSLQSAYSELCDVVSLHEVVAQLAASKATTAVKEDAVAKALEADRQQVEFLMERSRRVSAVQISHAEENARRAVDMQRRLRRRERRRWEIACSKALQKTQEMDQKRNTMARLAEARTEAANAAFQAAEEKRLQLYERVAALRMLRQTEAHQRAEQKNAKILASRARVAASDAQRTQALDALLNEKHRHAQLFLDRVAVERAARLDRSDNAEMQRELARLRATERQLLVQECVAGRLAAAARRQEEFERDRQMAREMRSSMLRMHHRKIQDAVAAAQHAEKERAEHLLKKQAALDDRKRQLRESRAANQAEEAVQHDFSIVRKQRIVELTSLQAQFHKLCQFTTIQEREEAVDAFQKSNRDTAVALRRSRALLRVRNEQLKQKAAASMLTEERRAEQAIHRLSLSVEFDSQRSPQLRHHRHIIV